MPKIYRLEIIMNEKGGFARKEFSTGITPIELMGLLEIIKLEKLTKIKLKGKMEVGK